VLSSRFANDDSGSRLALTGTNYYEVYACMRSLKTVKFNYISLLLICVKTFAGAIKDSLLEEYDIAQFLLALVNSHEEYRKWENSNQVGDNVSFGITGTSKGHDKKYQYVSDNTQVSVAEFRVLCMLHPSIIFISQFSLIQQQPSLFIPSKLG
jgi:hypothetical protein